MNDAQDINVLGISDVQYAYTGKLTTKNGMIYYAGNSYPVQRYGVAILLDKEINKPLINFTPFSERIVMVQLKTNTSERTNSG